MSHQFKPEQDLKRGWIICIGEEQRLRFFIENLVDFLAISFWFNLSKLTQTQTEVLLQAVINALDNDVRIDHVVITETSMGDVQETIEKKLLAIKSRLSV